MGEAKETVATDYGGVSVLTVRDELAGDAVEAFTHEVSRCLERRRFDIVLDCGGLVQVDSAGLEALLDLWERCEAEFGAVRLCNVDHVAKATPGWVAGSTRLHTVRASLP